MRKAIPAARASKLLVCRNLGIVKDGEDVIARTLEAFPPKFKDQLSQDVLALMRALFKIDDEIEMEMEEALLFHGGNDALDHDDAQDGATTVAFLVT
ncbi:hypothetical protein ZWY2020_043255 [Hordeum vulgare]|nr:hypothetical protein ZWY2020_043255 [Hordeum vulgare]